MNGNPTTRNPVMGLSIGIIGGALAASICLFIGYILYGIGWGIVGVPVMIGGVIAGIGIPVWGFFFVSGQCPYCMSMQMWSRLSNSFTCKTCKKVIEIRQGKFWAIPK